MSVYIDDAFIPFRRMLMSHMIADTHEELIAMARAIGIAEKWIQKAGTHWEHFDVSKDYRERAIQHGAMPQTPREIAMKMRDRREAVSSE